MSDLERPLSQRWRDLALEHLPACAGIIAGAAGHSNLWQRLMEYLVDAAPDESRRAELAPVFAYAWWCVTQAEDDYLVAEVECFFYEDLAYYTNLNILIPVYIAPGQFKRLEKAFSYLYDDEEFAAFCSWYYEQIREASSGGTQ